MNRRTVFLIALGAPTLILCSSGCKSPALSKALSEEPIYAPISPSQFFGEETFWPSRALKYRGSKDNFAKPSELATAGDLSGNGRVDDADLELLHAAWWVESGGHADVNSDGAVDEADALIVMQNFGNCAGRAEFSKTYTPRPTTDLALSSPSDCLEDVSGNGVVDDFDLQLVSWHYYVQRGGDGDINGDGKTDGRDVVVLLEEWDMAEEGLDEQESPSDLTSEAETTGLVLHPSRTARSSDATKEIKATERAERLPDDLRDNSYRAESRPTQFSTGRNVPRAWVVQRQDPSKQPAEAPVKSKALRSPSAKVLVPRKLKPVVYPRAHTSADPMRITVLTFNIHAPGLQPCTFDDLREKLECFPNYPQGYDCCLCCETDEACLKRCAEARFDAMAQLIAESSADIVLLQEVDSRTYRLQYTNDVTEVLCKKLEILTNEPWEGRFEKACQYGAGEYGDAILATTRSMIKGGSITLNGDQEAYCGAFINQGCSNFNVSQQMQAIYADVRGMRVIGVHLTPRGGQACRDRRDEQLDLAKRAIVHGRPTVFAGDFNEDDAIIYRNLHPADGYFNATAGVLDTVVGACEGKIDHVVTKNIAGTHDFRARIFGDHRASDHHAVGVAIPQEWDIIVPLELGSKGATGLVFYKRHGAPSGHGRGEIYHVNDAGQFEFRFRSDTWRSDWHSIVAGDFDGDRVEDDLLFYDQKRGVGEFYRVEGDGALHLMARYTTWRTTWDIIVPIEIPPRHLPGPYNQRNTPRMTGVVFYDREGGNLPGKGLGQVYALSGLAKMGKSPLSTHRGWRSSWNTIVTGDFNGDYVQDDLLFYDASAGRGEFYQMNRLGNLTKIKFFSGWRTTWDEIIPLRMNSGGPTTDHLLFHDRTGGEGETSLTQLYSVRAWQSLTPKRWRKSWTTIVAAPITPTTIAEELFFYDRSQHDWSLKGFERSAGHWKLTDFTPRSGWDPPSAVSHRGSILIPNN